LGQTYHWGRDESLSLYLEEFVESIEAALRDRYHEMVVTLSAVEAGVARSLSRLFSKKSLPQLPSWEEFREGQNRDEFDEELWWLQVGGAEDGGNQS